MKMVASLFVVLAMLMAAPSAFAQDKSPAQPGAVSAPAMPAMAPAVAPAMPVAAPVVAEPSKVESSVKGLMDKIPGSLPVWLISILAFLCELVMRFWPTIKPRSIFILVGNLFGMVGDGFIKISKLLDAIVQNLKDDSGGNPPASKVA